ncbi:MAG: 2-amino-4-hydroxy-6-hydroxymethyldihydropteridine diphosphokinase [Clostridiaceae bacterium]|nr:2-amino-4-hydroxy-6-hydroxymethyldihydropteridine diphosphokinase [Clostridiaceae bacterium]
MDKIIIKDLEVYAYHGVNQQEKDMGQKFLVSLELYLDLKEAGESDDLNKTISYAAVCSDISEELRKSKYDLIEKVAEETASFILLKYNSVKGVKILIKKPWAPIGKSLDYAGVEIERFWHTVFIAIGSNLGNKEENLRNSIKRIGEHKAIEVTRISTFVETEPVGYLDQDKFLNGVIQVKTLLTPKQLIKYLLNIELELKRERTIKWGPRTIDLDVLLYDDIITWDEEIIIPHPRMHERLFVLKPLSEIAPYAIHPLLNKRIISLLEEL